MKDPLTRLIHRIMGSGIVQYTRQPGLEILDAFICLPKTLIESFAGLRVGKNTRTGYLGRRFELLHPFQDSYLTILLEFTFKLECNNDSVCHRFEMLQKSKASVVASPIEIEPDVCID